MFLLDSDHLGLLQRQRGEAFERLEARIQRVSETELYIPIIAFHERMKGWSAYLAKTSTESEVIFAYGKFREILADFASVQLLDYSVSASAVYQQLIKQRIRVGTMDLRIAAIAIDAGFTLLSCNSVDFERIPGLKVEDWTLP